MLRTHVERFGFCLHPLPGSFRSSLYCFKSQPPSHPESVYKSRWPGPFPLLPSCPLHRALYFFPKRSPPHIPTRYFQTIRYGGRKRQDDFIVVVLAILVQLLFSSRLVGAIKKKGIRGGYSKVSTKGYWPMSWQSASSQH